MMLHAYDGIIDHKLSMPVLHIFLELTPGAALHKASATAQSPVIMVMTPHPWLKCHYQKLQDKDDPARVYARVYLRQLQSTSVAQDWLKETEILYFNCYQTSCVY